MLNQLINNPELKVDINRDAAFTPDCAKAILLSSANTSVVIVDITSEKVEMLRLEDVVIRPDSKVSISPDGDTAFFLSYPYNTDNLLYGYGVSDSGSECVICDLFVPVSGPMGNVTWNKVGSNIGGGSNPPYVLPYVPSKYVDPPVSDVPDGGEGDITVPDEDSEPDPTETDDGDPEPDNTNNGEANLDPNNLSDPNNYNLNPPPIPPVPDNGDFYPPTVPGYDDSVTPIPEPRTLILLSSGLIGLIWLIRKLKTEN
ncbi:MAG: PEP-CTERM sorting domain-containing protein [Thermodesulfobacteriota bacterium]